MRSGTWGARRRVLVAACGGATAAAAVWGGASYFKPVVSGAGTQCSAVRSHADAGLQPGPDQRTRARLNNPVSAVNVNVSHASDQGPQGVNVTFDNTPDPIWAPQVLRVLKDNGVKATFCMTGPEAEAHPAIVKAIAAAGHRLCLRAVSYQTAMPHYRSHIFQRREVLDGARMITEASEGIPPLYYRVSEAGFFTLYSRQTAASHGMRPLGWDVDAQNCARPGVPAMVSTIQKEIASGPTILFRDVGGDRSQNANTLKQILPWLKQEGYVFGFPVR
ncbi:polysaccharide deacetylase family protein [Streptomyces sp. CAS3]